MSSPKKTAAAKAAPALVAFASSDLATYGHGVVVVAREVGAKSDTATFVVDALATGVRRANRSTVTTATFLNKVLPALHAEHATTPVPPAVALAILTGAVAFAKKAGCAPADAYEDALSLFGETEPAPAPFPFGKAGKPHFRPMPGDKEEFVEATLCRLRKACGPAGFTYDLDEFNEEVLDGDDDAESEGGAGEDY